MAAISLVDWRSGGRRHVHRGHEIFWRGSTPSDAAPLLLIHGFPTGSWDWSRVWDDLARDHRLLAPDLLGFGFSAKPRPYAYSTPDQADLCEGLLRAQGITSCHVLAHDYGDTVAQELLARGTRILSVCFLNGGLIPGAYRPRPVQRLLLSPLGPLAARLIGRRAFERSMRRLFGRTPPDEPTIEAFWQLVEANDGRGVLPAIQRYILERERLADRWVGALRDATVPLALVDGADDPISGAHMAEAFREVAPRATVTVLEGVGHYPQVEAPAAVLAAYRAFRAAAAG